MKFNAFIIFVGLLLVSACSFDQAVTEIVLEPSNTSIPTETQKHTITPYLSSTPVPTETSTPTSSPTPTDNPAPTYKKKPLLTSANTPGPTKTSYISNEYINYTIPHWISLRIPEDWYSIRSPGMGDIALSNKDIDFPYFSLKDGRALVVLFEYGDPDQSPIEILENEYLETISEDSDIVEKPKSITVNDLPAATASWTSPQTSGTAIEQLTIVIDQGRSIAILSIALENEFEQFAPLFTEIINSLEIYPIAPGPVVQELDGEALDNYLLYNVESQGVSFHYPKDWDMVEELSDNSGFLFIKPPDVENLESILGMVIILTPDVMQADEEEGSQEKLESYLYTILSLYGWMIINDAQVTSIPEIKKIGAQEFLTVFVGATEEGIPISGVFSVVKKEDQVLGLFTWMYELDDHIHDIETILSSIILD